VKHKPSDPDFERTRPDSSKLSQDILASRQEPLKSERN
jgi:hypothetical protein